MALSNKSLPVMTSFFIYKICSIPGTARGIQLQTYQNRQTDKEDIQKDDPNVNLRPTFDLVTRFSLE